ncbi:MAG TPA: hypothetical protein VLH58_05660 [Candidatus Methylomirabilis sp.]|nr:hypothetical protein [Candidatus Methylomirabilis sp.]HSC70818.1 hypothetical protein [Candidatus Methylomirabilis sp.]
MTGLAGRAFVAIWHDIAPEGKAEFYAWHTREHMPERLGVTGFLRGRRYVAERGGPEYFNLYEVESPAVLTGAEYLSRLNQPTPWTQRVLPHFRNVSRSLCRLGASLGRSQGGVIATTCFETMAGQEAALGRFLAEQVLPRIFDRPGVVGAHFGVADRSGSEIVTAERKARGSLTLVPGWVVLVEGLSCAAVEQAVRELAALPERGVQGPVEQATYRLECSLARPDRLG